MRASDATAPSLPRLLNGTRRVLLGALVCAGLGQAALAGVTAVSMPRLLQAAPAERWWWFGVLLASALCMGGIRVVEWVLAEKLGQDYVHEIRVGLLAAALSRRKGPSLGTTIARATNDLTAVRNWVAWGIGPMAGGIPLIVGVLVVLMTLHPALAVAVAVPVLLLGVFFGLVARTAFRRARTVRKARGRLASQVSDTVAAGSAIRAGGGVHRELNRIQKLSGRVRATAVRRARVAGFLRGTAVSTAALATLGVVVVGTLGGLQHAMVATTITIVGVLATPIHDLGRVVEYRQSFLAARRILAPALVGAQDLGSGRGGPALDRGVRGPAEVHVHELWVDGVRVPGLAAAPGSRVVLTGGDRDRIAAVIGLLAGLDTTARGWVRVAGCDLGRLGPAQRRRYVGYAARGLALERGTVARAVRYRRPESDAPVEPELDAVGLGERVRSLPDRERTTLRRGGEPLSVPERARLQLARACYLQPPLLILDHIDDELGAGGAAALRELLADYPGVVVLATDSPETIAAGHQVWDLTSVDGDPNRVALAGFHRR